jgi:type IV pilus biogenesis protein CpaD/CtpE
MRGGRGLKSMNSVGLGGKWLKAVALAGTAMFIAGCQMDEADQLDDYQPVAHYERHPIIVTKSGAHVKQCGNWPKDMAEVSDNEPYDNFGCAQQNNLAAMVANPQDLVRPRTQTPPDAMRRIKVIDKYRAGEQIGSAEEEKQKVEISKIAAGSQ